MKNFIHISLTFLLIIGLNASGFAQGLPPGWDYSATPSNHIISIPLTAEPNINGYLLNPGDWIGVFYTNDDGILVCGGATEWLGDQNTGIIAFGDDAFTGEKDGFSSGEEIAYRFYSWSVEKEYDAEAECNDNLPVTCASFVSNGLSGCDSIWANGYYLVATATPDSICNGDETQLLVEPSGGSGNYIYSWTSEPAGFNASIPDPVASPNENTTYFASVTDDDETLEITVFVEVFPEPVANAGPDYTICEDSVITVSGSHNNSSSFFWDTEGDGTFSNPNILVTDYTPGTQDISNGGVILNFTAQPISPCAVGATDSMDLSLIGLPEVDAGEDQTFCEDQTVPVSATLLNAIEIFWTTTGDGTFENPNQIETTYIPGNGDISSGMVELSAVAQALTPCQAVSQDQIEVSFEYLPVIIAGTDQVICETQNVLLSGTVENSNGISWETNGDGTFENNLTLETIYYPGINDISNGNVQISLIGEAISPCVGTYNDVLEIDIIAEPEANAGEDATICETGNLQLNGYATNYEEILWSTNGDGTFSDPNTLNTNYFPGPEDLMNLQVQIHITVQPLYPCITQVMGSMDLYIIQGPEVNAGEDFTIPLGDNYLALGEADNFSSVLWASSGDGIFENMSSLETNYTPGDEDINNAGAVLSLTAVPIDPCATIAVDELTLTIDTVTSVQTFNPNKYISLYPNPSHGLFYVDIQGVIKEDVQIYVYDNMGQLLFDDTYENEFSNRFSRKSVDLGVCKSGIYVVQIVASGRTISRKILISKGI